MAIRAPGDLCPAAQLAQVVVDAGTVAYLVPMTTHPDGKLKRQVCSCLSQIAKHSVDLAETIVEAEVFPKIFVCLKDVDKIVRRNAATCIREIAKHTPELAQLIVNQGGHGAIVDYCNESVGAARLPGVMALGYIAAFSETLALAVIMAQGEQTAAGTSARAARVLTWRAAQVSRR